jgi:hypothetical protein
MFEEYQSNMISCGGPIKVTHCKKNKILSFKLASREATYIPIGAGIFVFQRGKKILE